jgi:zinc protease
MTTATRMLLSNGIEVLLAPKQGAQVVSVQVYVWAGSIDENANEHGAAHFIEHMLFKGTPTRKVGDVGSEIEANGGDVNAYTTFDRTVYYATLPSKSMQVGLDILSDAIFRSLFDPAEVEREREVILEEVRRGLDDPGSVIGKKVFELMFEGTPVARPIIGFESTVSQMSRDDLLGFYNRHYHPHNMSVVVTGSFDDIEAKALVERFFNVTPSQKSFQHKSRMQVDERFQRPGQKAAFIGGDYEQTRIEIALPGPSMTDIDGLAIDLLAYILGGNEIARLQRTLRDRDRVVSSIGMSAYSPSFRGLVEISATTDPSKDAILKAIESCGRELNRFVQVEPATKTEIDRAKAAFYINKIHREETVDGTARAMGLSLMTPLKEKFEDTYETLLKSNESEDIHQAARSWLRFDQCGIVVLGKNELELKEHEILAAFNKGLKSIADSDKKKINVTQKVRSTEPQVHRGRLDNGVEVIYRAVPDARMVALMATTEGGLRFEDTPQAGRFLAMSSMLGMATEQKSYETFTGRLEDLGSVISGFSGKDSCGWEVHTVDQYADETIDLWCEAFNDSKIPEEQWESQKRELLHGMLMQRDSAGYRVMRQVSEAIFKNHPYASPTNGWPETIEAMTNRDLETFYRQWRDSGPWTIAAASGLPWDQMQKKLNQTIGKIKFAKSSARQKITQLTPRKSTTPLSTKMEKEQTHVALAWPGTNWKDPDRAVLDVLTNILGGHGGRLFLTLRDQESLAYSVAPLMNLGVDAGYVGAYMACKPEKVQQAIQGMKREIAKAVNERVTADELSRAKNHIIGHHEINLQRTSSQAMTMGLMELYGVGWDNFLKYPRYVESVDIESVKRVAERFFGKPPSVEAVVGRSV